jgi:hypothetical protein
MNANYSLFEELPSPQERMEKKLDYIHEVITNQNFKFKRKKEGDINHKMYMDQRGIIVLKIANSKQLELEEDFKIEKHHYSPSCFVIIDYRKDCQRIAIEEDISSFSNTDVVRNIIEYTLKHYLKQYGLSIEIKKEYDQNEFWTLVSEQEKGVSMVRFTFSYPNLPRVHNSISELINNESATVNSKRTTFEYRTDETEQLELNESNEQLSGLVDASANSGHEIIIKARGIKKFIKTGKTTKSIEIDDFEAICNAKDGDMFLSQVDKIIEKLNSVE